MDITHNGVQYYPYSAGKTNKVALIFMSYLQLDMEPVKQKNIISSIKPPGSGHTPTTHCNNCRVPRHPAGLGGPSEREKTLVLVI